MRETVCFDALGFTFRVWADDQRLTSYIAELFSDLSTSRSDDHSYVFRTNADTIPQQRSELVLDGRLMANAATAEELVMTLVQNVNRQAVDESPSVALHAS